MFFMYIKLQNEFQNRSCEEYKENELIPKKCPGCQVKSVHSYTGWKKEAPIIKTQIQYICYPDQIYMRVGDQNLG